MQKIIPITINIHLKIDTKQEFDRKSQKRVKKSKYLKGNNFVENDAKPGKAYVVVSYVVVVTVEDIFGVQTFSSNSLLLKIFQPYETIFAFVATAFRTQNRFEACENFLCT